MDNATIRKPVRRSRRGRDEWCDIIARFEQSGQSRNQFCAEHDLGVSTFTRWRQRLRGVSQVASSDGDGALFVELAQPAPGNLSSAWDVELHLGAGMVLRLRRSGC